MSGQTAAVVVGVVVSVGLMIGWIIYGYREYRRSGQVTWLLMAVLLLVSLFTTLGYYLRWWRS